MPVPSKQNQLSRISTRQYIYNEVKNWIIDGTLQPGEFINETVIANHFGVSRTPVRESILLLVQQDFLKNVPTKGTQVAEANLEMANTVYEALSCMSAEIARLAVRKHRPEDINQLKKINTTFEKAVHEGDTSATLRLDEEFHSYLLIIADNSFIESSWKSVVPHSYRYESLYFKTGVDKEQSVADHNRIIKAIENNDEGEAARCSQQNWIGFFEERLKPRLSK